MDLDTPQKHGSNSSSSVSGPSASQRKERGAIAAQACDTCRSRKQKCDEQRPKCSTCQKFKLECHYREPQPTKKDKTLVEILERIKSLEGKIDSLNRRRSWSSTLYGSSTIAPPSLVTEPSVILASETITPVPLSSLPHSESSSSVTRGGTYRYVSGVHQMLGWPVIQQLLETLSPKVLSMSPGAIEHDGANIVLGLDDAESRLPIQPAGPLIMTDFASATALNLPNPNPPSGLPLTNSALTWDAMQRLSKAYFDTFNFLYPIMDRQVFVSGVLSSVFNEGFDDSISSTLAFLVFALGEVAIAGLQGTPIDMHNGRPSGVKGGSVDQPPGLALFNEARKRMGFTLTECSLENVQVFALAGIYCGACSQHMEFWRMSTTASLACQALVTSKPSELNSPRVDLIRRAFWYCSIIETYFNLELGLPLTGLEKLEGMVGLPDFSGPYSQDDYLANQASHFQEHFASQIVLRRLTMEFHTSLTNADLTRPAVGSMPTSFSSITTTEGATAALPATMKQMALQLDQWRGVLPAHLRWQESSPAEFPNPAQAVFSQPMFPPTVLPVPSVNSPSGLMFTTDLDSTPVNYPYALDVQVALLRTRYYYSKYLIYRPFIYKALHHPEQMTREAAEGAAECLKACLKWPVTMSPTCTHKRMVPCLFFWTQNLLGILVLLHLSRQVPILSRIRTTLCGDSFELEASETVGLYMDWIRDLKSIDKAAERAWELLRCIYRIED